MATMCSLATLIMVGVMFLAQLSPMLAALKGAWATITGAVSGLLTTVKGLFAPKA